jgi:hypothetical protein
MGERRGSDALQIRNAVLALLGSRRADYRQHLADSLLARSLRT